METTEVLEEIKKMSSNQDRIDRVKRFINEDPKFKQPFHGDLLAPIPRCLLFLLEYVGPIDELTEGRYFSQRDFPIVEQNTYKFFAREVRKMKERWEE